ncbi:sodium:alanine symporter family protein [Motiliproteus sp. MSK22-1]|uniref:alanine/glycine:cation symporter family protein n=1 Tax=Motiliproteus sp. MSK22-1 TaxID=1897630 RepID=UPI0009755179|nr:alanine/glycine:cation symporter family protein [Motiliproteus sp. MSK22-1]OMH35319.1 alanine glycine permease [Motiliproteus sp. MSK22-1]
MKAWICALLSLFISPLASASDGVDQAINEAIAPISNVIAGIVFYSVPVGDASLPLIVVWLVVAAIFFTVYFGFINVRGFSHSIKVVRGDFTNPRDKGEVSHFQALTAALSGTVGLGNIAGVAIAVSIGGPGATFWMIVGGLLGMSSKFVECTLGVKYRNINPDGSVSGGPMYYLSKGLAEQGKAGLGKFLAVFFAICCIGGAFGAGNMFQANQAVQQVISVTGGDASFFAGQAWVLGLVMAVLVGIVIIGGIKSIGRVTERIVPFMAGIYVAAALVILFMNMEKIPEAFGLIFAGAFSAAGVTGGVIGCMIQGFKRASFSNEAGIGSAAIAHSAVKTNEPLSEGFVSLLEPFIDTVVICTMTALVIVITGAYANNAGLGGVALTSSAFESAISWFPYVLAVAVVLFAFSTMLSWSYYGTKAWTYLFGESKASDLTFKFIFCGFVVVGASMSLGPVIDFSDSMIFAMSIANIAGLYMLAPVVKRELSSYLARINSGEITNHRTETVEEEGGDTATV